MIVQWDSSLSVLPVARFRFPATAEYFEGFFSGWSHSANPSWASVSENGSISPQWHHTVCGQQRGRPKSYHGQTIADRKKRLPNISEFSANWKISSEFRSTDTIDHCLCLNPVLWDRLHLQFHSPDEHHHQQPQLIDSSTTSYRQQIRLTPQWLTNPIYASPIWASVRMRQ